MQAISRSEKPKLNQGRYRNASFANAVHNLHQLPPEGGVEVAFAGRSNSGKSSCINRLCGQVGMAKTSRTPGRTQQIVVFDLDEERRIMDLPGYGYAKVPADLQRHWQKLLDTYLQKRQCLAGLVLMMDSRHPLKPYDLQMLDWLGATGLAGHVVLTKSDKIKRLQQSNAMLTVKKYLEAQQLQDQITVQLFSALKNTGVAQLEQRLDEWYQWPEHKPQK